MSKLEIELHAGQTSFQPGAAIRGTAGWDLDEPPEALDEHPIRLDRGVQGAAAVDDKQQLAHRLGRNIPPRSSIRPPALPEQATEYTAGCSPQLPHPSGQAFVARIIGIREPTTFLKSNAGPPAAITRR